MAFSPCYRLATPLRIVLPCRTYRSHGRDVCSRTPLSNSPKSFATAYSSGITRKEQGPWLCRCCCTFELTCHLQSRPCTFLQTHLVHHGAVNHDFTPTHDSSQGEMIENQSSPQLTGKSSLPMGVSLGALSRGIYPSENVLHARTAED